MSGTDTYKAIVEAISLGDGSTARRLNAELDADGHQELYEFAMAFLSICLERRFKADIGLDAIRTFANQMQYDFRNSEVPVKQTVVEAVIRGFAGEEHLLEEVPVEEQANVQYPIIRKIVAEDEQLQNELHQVLNEAEEMVTAWAREEQ